MCAALISRCERSPVADGGTDLPNTRTIEGALVTSDGKPATHARVLLLEASHNCVVDSTYASWLADTTDEGGMYHFSLADTGEYTITAVQLDERTRAIICSVHVVSDTVRVDTATMQIPGTIMVALPDGFDSARGYVYIPGTTIAATSIGNGGSAELDSVPAGTIPSVNYGASDIGGVTSIRYDIPVAPGTTTTVRYPFWNYAEPIVLNTTSTGAAVSGNITGFPVLIRLSEDNFTFAQAHPAGSDLRFAKNDGTPLAHEIERWDPVARLAEVWVRVDTVFGNNNTQNIMMYWGAADLSADSGDTSDGASVFDTASGFAGVWHLSGTDGSTVVDATANRYHGIPRGNLPPATAPGIIGNANIFNGADFIEMPGTASGALNFPEHGTYSISAWVTMDSLAGEYQMIASKGDKQYNLQFKGATTSWQFTEYQDTIGWDETASGAVARSWVYLVGVRSGLRQYLYVNGVCADSGIYNHPYSPSDTSYAEKRGYRNTACNFMIGKKVDYASWYFRGSIDEVRVGSVAPGADWIRLCYMNQRTDDKLVVFRKRHN
jgi:hypothetical protein